MKSFAHIDLALAREQARELVTAHHAGDRRALDRIRWNHPRFRGLTKEQIQQGEFTLADAESVTVEVLNIDPLNGQALSDLAVFARQRGDQTKAGQFPHLLTKSAKKRAKIL